MTRPERCSQNQRVEMTAMICREHERPVCRQFLPARDCESMSDREVNSQHRKARLLRHAFEQTAFASHAAKPLGRSQPSVTRWLQLPWFHWHHPRENALRLPSAETDKITDVVKHSRRDQNQAIEAIQQSAVPGMSFAVSLRPRSRLIAESIKSPNWPTMLTMIPRPTRQIGLSNAVLVQMK